jgi:TolA-binding protein
MKTKTTHLTQRCVFLLFLCCAIGDGYAETANDLFNQGKTAFNQDDYQQAARAFQRAVALQPEFGDAHYYLGLTYSQMGKPHRAIVAFKRVVTLDADAPENYYNLGILYHGLWVLDRASQHYRGTVDRDTDLQFREARFFLGQVYFNLGQYSEAEGYYRRFLKLNPTDPQRVEETNQNLRVIQQRRKNPLPSPPVRLPPAMPAFKTRGRPTFPADFYQATPQKLQPTNDIPFSPDIHGRYQRRTEYLVNFRPYPADNVFLMWKAVVEHVRYQRDINAHRLQDAWQYPQDTYRFRQGDCEDSALLLCDWLRAMGHDAKVVMGKNRDGAHAWVALKDGDEIYYLETAVESTDISRRHLPRLNASMRQYQIEELFDSDTYWRTSED